MQNQGQEKITSIKNLDSYDISGRISKLRNSHANIQPTFMSERVIPSTSLSEKTFDRSKMGRKNQSKTEEDMKEIEEVWQLRENDSKKQDSYKIEKSSQLDTLIAVAAILILFCLALHLAPNQFHTTQN